MVFGGSAFIRVPTRHKRYPGLCRPSERVGFLFLPVLRESCLQALVC